jgi:hypothetical protein
VIASADAAHDLIVVAFLPPLQLLLFQALRRPLEFTQYLSIRYTERLAEAGIEPSVGSRGDSYDNALAETIIGLYKTELVLPRRPWASTEDLELATLEWVWWFNNHRLLEPIGDIPPAEREEQYRSTLTAQSDSWTRQGHRSSCPRGRINSDRMILSG